MYLLICWILIQSQNLSLQRLQLLQTRAYYELSQCVSREIGEKGVAPRQTKQPAFIVNMSTQDTHQTYQITPKFFSPSRCSQTLSQSTSCCSQSTTQYDLSWQDAVLPNHQGCKLCQSNVIIMWWVCKLTLWLAYFKMQYQVQINWVHHRP